MGSCRAHRAFSMVEMLMVVMIIGLLAAIAIPTMIRARQNSQVARFIHDVGVAAAAFELYRMEHKGYPPDTTAGVIPAGMEAYLTGFRWSQGTALGGLWGWDVGRFGVAAQVTIFLGGNVREEPWIDIDRRMDDGNLETGKFRRRPGGFAYVVEF